jgi:hypothetical protein
VKTALIHTSDKNNHPPDRCYVFIRAIQVPPKGKVMTVAHVEKFAELVGKDPALLAKLGLDKVNADAAAAFASAAAFIANAVKEAKAHGLEFTEEEAKAYLAAEAKAAASGELSDTQLEAVAGGKYQGKSKALDSFTAWFNGVVNDGK